MPDVNASVLAAPGRSRATTIGSRALVPDDEHKLSVALDELASAAH